MDVVHIWEAPGTCPASPRSVTLWFFLGTELLVSLPVAGPVSPSYMWNWGKCVPGFPPHLIWIFLPDLSQSVNTLQGQMQTVQWRTLRFRAGLSNKTFWNDAKFPFCTLSTVASSLMRLLRTGHVASTTREARNFTFHSNGTYDSWLVGLCTSGDECRC